MPCTCTVFYFYHYTTLHWGKNWLNLRIKTEPVTIGARFQRYMYDFMTYVYVKMYPYVVHISGRGKFRWICSSPVTLGFMRIFWKYLAQCGKSGSLLTVTFDIPVLYTVQYCTNRGQIMLAVTQLPADAGYFYLLPDTSSRGWILYQ